MKYLVVTESNMLTFIITGTAMVLAQGGSRDARNGQVNGIIHRVVGGPAITFIVIQ